MAMSLDVDIALLGAVPFFEGFDDEHLRLLAFSAEARSLPVDLVLHEAGQPLHSCYVIKKGLVTALRGEDSRTFGPGALIGERALIVEAKAMETVRVAQTAQVLQIRRAVFRRFLDEYPEMAAAIRARIAGRVRQSAADYNRIARRISAIQA
jgi:CRP-like cAMP-binding protein